jgi:DNA-binding response OmpR family regulator
VRVLVVEDEPELADIVANGLRAVGMAADVASDGIVAQQKAAVHDYDVVVLDRALPRLSGDQLCAWLHGRGGGERILMLTAADRPVDRIQGLGIGADDYLVKPFVFGELVARVRALARRSPTIVPLVLRHRDIELDTARHRVTRGGRELILSPKEFAVLAFLLQSDGAAVSAETLLARVWDERTDAFSNTVRMTIMRLRRRLGEPQVIGTVPGIGYRLQ